MNVENKIKEVLKEYVNKKCFSGVSVGISFKDENIRRNSIIYHGNLSYKKEENVLNDKTFFDIASMTKPFAGVLSLLSLVKNKKLSINDSIDRYIKNIEIPLDKKKLTIKSLISHSSGFPSHRDYFYDLVKIQPEKRNDLLLKLILEEKLEYKSGDIVLYSDIGYMLLGIIIEKITGMKLDCYLKKYILEPFGLEKNIFFNPIGSGSHRPEQFAAGENCPWRGRVLQGEVSDENCWALGGVAGHAGLYGDTPGVLGLAELIMDIWLGKVVHPNINRADLVYFSKRRKGVKDNTWALGFDTPTPGTSSSGKYLSPTSIGHLGFTGTSFWIDCERQLVIVILSNRVHPSRENALIKEFRPVMHDKIVEWLCL